LRNVLALLALCGCTLITKFEPVPEELAQCTDDLDNDDDGDIDCADDGCASAPACTPGCGNGVVDPPQHAFTAIELDVAAPIALTAARIGADTVPDVVAASQSGAIVELRGGGGTLAPQPPIAVPRAIFTGVAAGFFGGSGSTGPDDVLALDTMLDELVTVPNGAAGLGQPFRGLMFGADPLAIVTGDLDSDGDLDAFVALAGAAPVFLRNQSGDGFAFDSAQVPEPPTALAAADLDGDQRTDLVLAVAPSDHLIVLTQITSTEGFPFAAAPPITVGDGPVAVAVANVNGAGRPDLVVASGGSSDLTVLLAGASGYSAAPAVPLGARPLSLAAADLDGDGDVDLAVGLAGARVAIYAGDGAGGFTLATTVTVDADPAALLALRVDGDSLADLVTAETAANRVTLLRNATVRETCDDGNTLDGDSCPADCTQP
jgi:cysteine-rich repeat protein